MSAIKTELVQIMGFYKNDEEKGFGAGLRVNDTLTSKQLQELANIVDSTVEGFGHNVSAEVSATKYNLENHIIPHIKREQKIHGSAKESDMILFFVAVKFLEDNKAIPDDNFNGMQYVRMTVK